MGVSQFFSKVCGSCCGGTLLINVQVDDAALLTQLCIGRSKDSIYDPVLADSEREAVADLLGFLENVPQSTTTALHDGVLTAYSALRPTSSLASPFVH